jgi:hypothetical protein
LAARLQPEVSAEVLPSRGQNHRSPLTSTDAHDLSQPCFVLRLLRACLVRMKHRLHRE